MTAPLTPRRCAEMIRQSACTVAFTGAGISTAAGIPDFRGPDGIYNSGQYDAEKVFEIAAFREDPAEFYRFTRDLVEVLDRVEPTFTHRLLARLEREGLCEGVITQNIDPLHQQAGAANVIPVHGSYATAHCLRCGELYNYQQFRTRLAAGETPRCDCPAAGVLKPDVVFFGEPVDAIGQAVDLAGRSELLLVLGSSLVVYPAAMTPHYAGGRVVVVNRGPVQLEPAPGRYFVEADLDEYFRAVAEALGLKDEGES